MQVNQFSDKSKDMSMRVASLDYLGIIAKRLRMDAVTSQLNEKTIEAVIKHVRRLPYLIAARGPDYCHCL